MERANATRTGMATNMLHNRKKLRMPHISMTIMALHNAVTMAARIDISIRQVTSKITTKQMQHAMAVALLTSVK